MNKQELISKLEAERARLEAAIESLTSEQMTIERAIGEWSVKDVLAHLAVWTSRFVTLVYFAEQDKTPPEIDVMFGNYDATNAADNLTQRERPLERILADMRGAYKQLLRRLGAWDDDDLFSPTRYAWLRGKSMAEFLISEAAGHDTDHAQQIEQWATTL